MDPSNWHSVGMKISSTLSTPSSWRRDATRILLVGWLGLIAIGCLLLYLQIFASNLSVMVFPDEISGYNTLQTFGFLGGIKYYWTALLGRFGAIAWFELPFWLVEPLHIWPWYTLVAARAANFVLAALALTLLMRTVLSGALLLSLSLSALLLSASFTSLGIDAVQSYWLLDQAIYFASFISYCVVLLLFWRIAHEGLDRWSLCLLPVFLLYLGGHEINLVSGGLMLALFFLVLMIRNGHRSAWSWLRNVLWPTFAALGRLRLLRRARHPFGVHVVVNRTLSLLRIDLGRLRLGSALRYGTSEQRLLLFLLLLGALYVLAAYLQVRSPSVRFRNGVWPAQMSFLQSLRAGLPAALMPLFELPLGLKGSVAPIFLSGLALAVYQGKAGLAKSRFKSLLLVPLAAALVVSLTDSVLATRIGWASAASDFPAARVFTVFNTYGFLLLPIRQAIYVYQLWLTGLFFAGVFAGLAVLRRWPDSPRHRASGALLAALVCGAWLTYAIAASPVFPELQAYDWIGGLRSMTARLAPLRGPPAFDSKAYIAEIPGWAPVHPGTYPYEEELQRMFSSAPILFAPCGAAGANQECNSEGSPVLERRLDDRNSGLAGIWRAVAGGSITSEASMVTLTEDVTTGEHYVATRPIAKSHRTLVEVTAAIKPMPDGTASGLVMEIVSNDGSASVRYDLANAKVVGPTEQGARALDAKARLRGSRIEIAARFVLAGEATDFSVRLLGEHRGHTFYRGGGKPQLEIVGTSIFMDDSGRSVSDLADRLGPSLPLPPVK
jgi:hypothetical protein